jgi:hypothetical protein
MWNDRLNPDLVVPVFHIFIDIAAHRTAAERQTVCQRHKIVQTVKYNFGEPKSILCTHARIRMCPGTVIPETARLFSFRIADLLQGT